MYQQVEDGPHRQSTNSRVCGGTIARKLPLMKPPTSALEYLWLKLRQSFIHRYTILSRLFSQCISSIYFVDLLGINIDQSRVLTRCSRCNLFKKYGGGSEIIICKGQIYGPVSVIDQISKTNSPRHVNSSQLESCWSWDQKSVSNGYFYLCFHSWINPSQASSINSSTV